MKGKWRPKLHGAMYVTHNERTRTMVDWCHTYEQALEICDELNEEYYFPIHRRLKILSIKIMKRIIKCLRRNK